MFSCFQSVTTYFVIKVCICKASYDDTHALVMISVNTDLKEVFLSFICLEI